MRTEVYSWRLSRELKTEVERAARSRGEPVSSVLETAVREWLKNSSSNASDDEEHRRLHAEAESCFGRFARGKRHHSQNVRSEVRSRLEKRHGR
jgi:hypothetical protein